MIKTKGMKKVEELVSDYNRQLEDISGYMPVLKSSIIQGIKSELYPILLEYCNKQENIDPVLEKKISELGYTNSLQLSRLLSISTVKLAGWTKRRLVARLIWLLFKQEVEKGEYQKGDIEEVITDMWFVLKLYR